MKNFYINLVKGVVETKILRDDAPKNVFNLRKCEKRTKKIKSNQKMRQNPKKSA
jgi:hypothetical protein